MSVSSDLVPVSGSSKVAAVAVKPGKKELVSADAVASWLESAASGKELLSSVIPSTVKKRYRGESIEEYRSSTMAHINTITAMTSIGGPVGAAFGLFSNINLIFAHETSFIAVITPMIVVMAVTGVAFYVPQRIFGSKCKVLWNKLMPVQSEGTRKWLEARYGVTVSNEVLTVLASGALTNQNSVPFADEKGQLWVLRKNSSGLYQVEPQQVAVEASEAPEGIRQAPVILSVGAGHLAGDAGKLGKHIDLRLAQLSRFALTVEESHGVARAVEDAREAVAGFERLELLGAGKNGLERLTNILSFLDGELDAILQTKIAEEDAALLARQKSVEYRQKSKKVIGV